MTVPTFPTLAGLTYPVAWSPSWRTIQQESISGKTARVQLWTYPRYKYEIPVSYMGSGTQQNQDWSTLVGFFNQVAGAALPFHWNWPFDNAVTNGAIGTGDGATRVFNFVRSLGGFIEPMQDVTTISSIRVNGVPTSAYTLLTDPSFGLLYGLQFNSAPVTGATITASFTYNWACRFDEDAAQLELFMYNFWSLKKLAFTTMKVV